MDDGLKQRIVGAFVLVAIGVVFIPVVFDRERIEPLDRQTQVPPAPSITPVEIAKPVAPKPDEPPVEVEDIFIPDETQAVDLAADKVEKKTPILNEKGTPNSWVLQIASYRFEAHAKERRDQLLEKGYSAFIREVHTDKGKMTRLYVGPNLDKGKIVAAKKSIDKLLGIETVVLKFEP